MYIFAEGAWLVAPHGLDALVVPLPILLAESRDVRHARQVLEHGVVC